MKRVLRLLGILLVYSAWLPAAMAGEGPKVLRLRPEDLRPYASKREILVTARDPFNWPPAQLKKFQAATRAGMPDSLSRLSLTAIIWDKKMPLAVINDGMYGIHDIVAGATVTAISKDSVVLDYKGTPYTLWFRKAFKLPGDSK